MTSPVLLNKAPPLLPGAMTAEVETHPYHSR